MSAPKDFKHAGGIHRDYTYPAGGSRSFDQWRSLLSDMARMGKIDVKIVVRGDQARVFFEDMNSSFLFQESYEEYMGPEKQLTTITFGPNADPHFVIAYVQVAADLLEGAGVEATVKRVGHQVLFDFGNIHGAILFEALHQGGYIHNKVDVMLHVLDTYGPPCIEGPG